MSNCILIGCILIDNYILFGHITHAMIMNSRTTTMLLASGLAAFSVTASMECISGSVDGKDAAFSLWRVHSEGPDGS